MGVRGLTSYIARKADVYLQAYELHDCDLVIDGDNLAYNLYKCVPECNSAFGGDYDTYYRTVINFFEILFKCNIRPFVLMDGGFEQKKMKTIEKRLRWKISCIKHVNPTNCVIFPLMMREVFIDAVKDSGGVYLMRCLFEADDELAILSRKLNCPILSYDSDFYIHNVKYIPSSTLTLKVLEKKKGVPQTTMATLSYTRACNVKKRMIANKTLRGAHWVDNSGPSSKQKTIRYLDCCVYTIENLTSSKRIRKDILPLFAALLGNDYIQSSIFGQFYSHIGMKGISTKITRQQKRIRAILNWLKHETKESALEKILCRMKKGRRDHLMAQIKSATDGYNIEESKAFTYFGLSEDDRSEDNESKIEDDELTVYENSDEGSEEEDEDDEKECEEDNNYEIQDVVNENNEAISCSSNSEENEDEQKGKSEILKMLEDEVDDSGFPAWLEQRHCSGELPRFIVDLLHLRLYVNNPQVENFLYNDCNEISIPILMHIYSLITYPESYELRYLTRVVRITNVHYKKLKPVAPYPFDPFLTDLTALKAIFPSNEFPTEQIFEEIQKIPSNLRIYFLSIIYWAKKSEHADVLHFYSIIICVAFMTTIDKHFAEIRNPKLFYKKFGKFIQNSKKLKENVNINVNGNGNGNETITQKISKATSTEQKAENFVKNLPPEEKIKFIPKITSAIIQERLLKYLNIPENFRNRHNEFSSSIVHGFAEFQSIVFFINSLNSLVNKPFESVKMSQVYSGIFLYNLYTTLKDRTDIDYFLKKFIFVDSNIIYDYYLFLLEWCKKFVSFFKDINIATKKSKKRSKRKLKKQSSSNSSTNEILSNAGSDMIANDSDTDTEFNDLNNKFCSLLRVQ